MTQNQKSESIRRLAHYPSLSPKRLSKGMRRSRLDFTPEKDQSVMEYCNSVSSPRLLSKKKKKRVGNAELPHSLEHRVFKYKSSVMYEKVLPPANELEPVWDDMLNAGKRRDSLGQIVKELTELPRFDSITVLSLEHLGLKRIFEYLKPCQSLIALYLKHNQIITRDLLAIDHLSALRTIDLSSNGVHFLPDEEHFVKLKDLSFLMLHKNEIVGSLQLKNLLCLEKLRYLTLQGNPCTKIKGYRKRLVEEMPQLRSLDSFIILDFERTEMAKMFPPEAIKESQLSKLKRFRPFNKEYQFWHAQKFSFIVPVVKQNSNKKSNLRRKNGKDILKQQSKPKQTLLSNDYQLTTDIKRIDSHLQKQLYELGRKFEYCSPILTIQKTFRRFVKRKLYLRKLKMTRLLIWGLNRWYKRLWVDRWLAATNLHRDELGYLGRVRFVQRWYRELRLMRSSTGKIAKRGQTIFRMRCVQDQSIAFALGLDVKNNKGTQKRLLFRKSQLSLLEHAGLEEQLIERARASQKFAVRSGVEVDTIRLRRSLIMNMVISSYKHARTLRSLDLFMQIIILAKVKSSQIAPAIVSKQFDSIRTSFKGEKNKEPTYDDDKILSEISFNDDAEMISALEKISSYNRQHEPVIEVFYEPFLRRLKAILCIQHWWKDLQWRKRQMPIFKERENGSIVLSFSLLERAVTSENTLQKQYMLVQRIVKRIQRVWRKRCLTIRINTLSNIAKYAATIDSNEIYLEQTMYRNLQQIHDDAIGAPWYTSKSTSEAFFDRKFRFEVSAVGKEPAQSVQLTYSKKDDKSDRYAHNILPHWFLKIADTHIPKLSSQWYRKSVHQNSILALIHSTISSRSYNHEQATQVLYLSELEGVRAEDFNSDTKLIKVTLPTIQEARNRAIVLALLTADVRHSSDKFVKFFTQSDFCGNQSRQTSNQIQMSLVLHNLVDDDILSQLVHSAVTLAQAHSGVIRKREEPYRTQLRSKPRNIKQNHERLIVLEGADTSQIEERIGNDNISPHIMAQITQANNDGEGKAHCFKINVNKKQLKGRQQSVILGPTKINTTTSSGIQGHLEEESEDMMLVKRKSKSKLTAADMAKLKLKSQQDRDKQAKVAALNRKLKHIKQRIEEVKETDVTFASNFAKELQSETDRSHISAAAAIVAGVGADANVAQDSPILTIDQDANVEVSKDDKNVELQVDHLFDELHRHQRAYRHATNSSIQQAPQTLPLNHTHESVKSSKGEDPLVLPTNDKPLEESFDKDMAVRIKSKIRDSNSARRSSRKRVSELLILQSQPSSVEMKPKVMPKTADKPVRFVQKEVSKKSQDATQPAPSSEHYKTKQSQQDHQANHPVSKDELLLKIQFRRKNRLIKIPKLQLRKERSEATLDTVKHTSLQEAKVNKIVNERKSLFAPSSNIGFKDGLLKKAESQRVISIAIAPNKIADKKVQLKPAYSKIDREIDTLKLNLKINQTIARKNINLNLNVKKPEIILALLPKQKSEVMLMSPPHKVFSIADKKHSLKDSCSMLNRQQDLSTLRFGGTQQFRPIQVEEVVSIPWTPAQNKRIEFTQTTPVMSAFTFEGGLNSQRSSIVESQEFRINPMTKFKTPICEENKYGSIGSLMPKLKVKVMKQNRNNLLQDDLAQNSRLMLTKQIVFSNISQGRRALVLDGLHTSRNASLNNLHISKNVQRSKVLGTMQLKAKERKQRRIQGQQILPTIIPSKLQSAAKMNKNHNLGQSLVIETIMSSRIAHQEIKSPVADIEMKAQQDYLEGQINEKSHSQKEIGESSTRFMSKKLLRKIDQLVTIQQSSMALKTEQKQVGQRTRSTALFTNVNQHTRRSSMTRLSQQKSMSKFIQTQLI